jgi:hypothetical protein
MTVVVNLEADQLVVEPGKTATGELSLINTGTIVEQFTILLIGEVTPWTEAEPPVVSLFPGAQQTVHLRFSPPRAYTTPAGEVPFAVKVIPSNEPEESVTEEASVTVGAFTDVGAELVPRVATGRVAGRQKLAVDNLGNMPLPAEVSAVDAAEALKFSIKPNKVITAPGEARFVKIRIKPRHRFWRGPEQQKPYKVTVTPEDQKPVVLDGALTQKSVLPKWALAAVGAAALLVLLWFLVLKPIVHNDAVNANKAALASQAAATQSLSKQLSKTQSSVAANQAAVAANQAAVAQNQAAVKALATNKPVPTTTTSTTSTTVAKVKVAAAPAPTTATTQPQPVTGPNDGRIEVVAAPGTTSSNSITIPSHATLEITNLVIQNVAGGAGRASIERLAAGAGQTPETLLQEDLATLNDQEYTFNSPVVFTSAQQLILSVNCAGDQAACDVDIYFTGPMTVPPQDTTTTFP